MNKLKTDIALMRQQAFSSVEELLGNVCQLIQKHSEAFAKVNTTCRFDVTDYQKNYGIKIQSGCCKALDDSEPADVVISGKQADLLALFKGTLSPAVAVLFGKIKVKGNLDELSAFSAFIG